VIVCFDTITVVVLYRGYSRSQPSGLDQKAHTSAAHIHCIIHQLCISAHGDCLLATCIALYERLFTASRTFALYYTTLHFCTPGESVC
jgi:hypothetical protein